MGAGGTCPSVATPLHQPLAPAGGIRRAATVLAQRHLGRIARARPLRMQPRGTAAHPTGLIHCCTCIYVQYINRVRKCKPCTAGCILRLVLRATRKCDRRWLAHQRNQCLHHVFNARAPLVRERIGATVHLEEFILR